MSAPCALVELAAAGSHAWRPWTPRPMSKTLDARLPRPRRIPARRRESSGSNPSRPAGLRNMVRTLNARFNLLPDLMRLDIDQNLADRAAAFLHFMCLGDALQRKVSGDLVLQHVVLQQADE